MRYNYTVTSIIFDDGYEVSVGDRVYALLRELPLQAIPDGKSFCWALVKRINRFGEIYAEPIGLSSQWLDQFKEDLKAFLADGLCLLHSGDIERRDSHGDLQHMRYFLSIHYRNDGWKTDKVSLPYVTVAEALNAGISEVIRHGNYFFDAIRVVDSFGDIIVEVSQADAREIRRKE